VQKSCTPEVINSKSAKSEVLLSISLLLIVLFIGPFLKKKHCYEEALAQFMQSISRLTV